MFVTAGLAEVTFITSQVFVRAARLVHRWSLTCDLVHAARLHQPQRHAARSGLLSTPTLYAESAIRARASGKQLAKAVGLEFCRIR